MDDPFLVCRLERVGDLPGERDRLVERKRTPRHTVGQRVPLDEFEHQGRHAVDVLQRVNRGDMRMIQRREQVSFALEARPTVGIRPRRRSAES